ncbi:hypothetical protein PISMIDRAFT_673772 [Pisolithus microcarpus 441]|uniref:Uncharacterized protein n=1 Tax=Pisolithus microcarpus 441 TaxID=765257 RepID=A0A0C9ZPT9_9AGAM|nr:hypothetical protein BKA83DRAFT_689593 [Pisolithus microcarpus]KIK12305.1 hypothetical protein PISMIDRAFT_689593 [Pisolithus microcarpus 441]KIK28084.1 hypothetical protein PISMIDRAFT_673772 [Pisolithus microcarpus 441]
MSAYAIFFTTLQLPIEPILVLLWIGLCNCVHRSSAFHPPDFPPQMTRGNCGERSLLCAQKSPGREPPISSHIAVSKSPQVREVRGKLEDSIGAGSGEGQGDRFGGWLYCKVP